MFTKVATDNAAIYSRGVTLEVMCDEDSREYEEIVERIVYIRPIRAENGELW